MKFFDHYSGDFYQIDGADIYYEITGNKRGPFVLLLHGGFGSIEDFNPILPTFNDKYCVIGIDSRGHGKSTTGGRALSYERSQKDVERLLRHLNIKELGIIGFSDGGIIAYRVAAFSSLKIEKLVTIGSRWHLNDALRTEELFSKMTAEGWKTKFPETYTLYQQYNLEPDFDQFFKLVVAQWLDKTSSGYPNEEVKNIKASLFIIRGDKDHLTSAKSVADLAALVSNSMLAIIPFAGHAAFIDQPEIFELSVKQFLN